MLRVRVHARARAGLHSLVHFDDLCAYLLFIFAPPPPTSLTIYSAIWRGSVHVRVYVYEQSFRSRIKQTNPRTNRIPRFYATRARAQRHIGLFLFYTYIGMYTYFLYIRGRNVL